MVKRNSGFSPQKDVRRSTRDRSAVYRSLAENNLANQHMNSELMKKILRTANESREQELQETKRLAGYTRSGRKLVGLYNFGSSEDEDDEPTANQRTRSSRNSYPDENDATSSIQKSRSRQVKRRRVALDDELDDEEQNSQDRVIRELEDSKDSCMYDRIKRNRHQNGVFSSTDASRSVSEIATSKRNTARSIRLEKKRIINEDPKDEEDAELVESSGEEGDEEEDNKEPRQYALRKNRNPVERFMFGSVKSERSHPAKFREESDISRRASDKRRERSSKLRGELRRRRMIRSTSSSTDGEDNEERFERRKERTMIDGHDNFLPINLTEKDLSSSQTVIRERLRQIGGPCTNIDPMNIDSNIGFEQVGGLASHIQSLKEIVLFPLIYSDVFKQFNISPPKGIVFYGPPGTGKTLVARALANECGKGGKKVAFFMRKGADCLSKWVGEAERQLRILFEQAYAMRPSIIFFDEIDGLAPVRSSRQDQIHSSIVSTLLALMDGLDNRGEVVVIGATNRLDTLDPALRRPGRFDRELRFSLPDANARLQILKIHTDKWGESKPDTEMLKWLAESTSGYCGADLQYLCAESVLIALRARYPHIYMSNERLALDPNEIKVEKVTFIDAMRKITPASRRDLTIPSRPLDERTCILLLTTIELLLSRIPSGYHCSQSAVNMANTELEKVVRALEQLPCIPAVRLLISGTDNIADNGQTSYILPALLGKLDHLPVFSVSVSRLFSEGRPEEALAHTIQSSLRAASSGPCILLLPSIDQWYNIVPPSVVHMLLSAIDTLNGFTSVLFLSTCDCEYYKLPNEIKEIFRPANSFRLSASQSTDRKKYFEHIIAPTRIPPKEFNASLYIAPEKVLTCDGSVTRKLSQKEAEEVSSKYESQLRQFRIFARDKLGRLMRDRRFNIFNMPVDVEDAQDYYEIIKNPMCLSDIMEKIDRKEYTHPDQFLDDIRLITSNALEYNPNISQEDKTIRHHAIALRDMAEELFDAELEEDFVELLENHAKMLLEANVKPKNEKLLQLPKGFERKTRWTVTNGYMTQVKPELLHKQVKVSVASVDKSLGRARFRTNRKGTYNFPNQQKRKKSAAIVKSIARSLSNSNPTNQLVDFKVDNESCSNVTSHIEDVIIENKTVEQSVRNKETKVKDIDHNQHKENKQLIICDKELQNVIIKCVEYTEGWSIPELERLAAVMTHHIEKFRNHWDRSILPRQLIETVETWENPHKGKYN